MKKIFLPGEILATVPVCGDTQYRQVTKETPAPTKAEKLLQRGSESPDVAQIAERTADMLMRFSLGQSSLFAEALMAAFPHMTVKEMAKASLILFRAADYFWELSIGKIPFSRQEQPMRPWTEEMYNLIRLFSVLSCQEEYCGFVECWETRRWDCTKDCARIQLLNEEGQLEMSEKFQEKL